MNRNERMTWIMLAESVLFPVIVGLAMLFGYTLRVGNGVIYALAATALYVFCAVRLLRSPDKQVGKAATAALIVTLLLDQLQTLFFILYVFVSGSGRFSAIPAMLLLAAWFWITVAVTAAYGKTAAVKVLFYVLSGLLVLPIGLFILLSGFGSTRVVASSVSPGGTWRAEVIEYDGGATGGSVEVSVYRNKGSFSIGSFEFRRDEEVVSRGSWSSPRDVSWIDDEHFHYNVAIYAAAFDYGYGSTVERAVTSILQLPKMLTS